MGEDIVDLVDVAEIGKATVVQIADIKIPFWSLVSLMINIAFAAIPAITVVAILWMLICVVFGLFFGIPFFKFFIK